MRKDEKEEIKSIIERQLKELEKQIAALEEKLAPVAPDCSLGRLTRMEALAEQEVTRKIHTEAQLRRTRLKNALSRIQRDDFGYCIECDEPIGFKRLTIRPESVRCVDCADMR
jgi:DnaK suppressor protein